MVKYFWCNGVRLGVKVKICKMKEKFRFCFQLLDVLKYFLFFEYFLCAGVRLGAKKRETLQMSRNITYFTFFVFYFWTCGSKHAYVGSAVPNPSFPCCRGAAGGAGTTARKRNEKLLAGLTQLLAHIDTDDSVEHENEEDDIVAALECLIQNRPRNLLQELKSLAADHRRQHKVLAMPILHGERWRSTQVKAKAKVKAMEKGRVTKYQMNGKP